MKTHIDFEEHCDVVVVVKRSDAKPNPNFLLRFIPDLLGVILYIVEKDSASVLTEKSLSWQRLSATGKSVQMNVDICSKPVHRNQLQVPTEISRILSNANFISHSVRSSALQDLPDVTKEVHTRNQP